MDSMPSPNYPLCLKEKRIFLSDMQGLKKPKQQQSKAKQKVTTQVSFLNKTRMLCKNKKHELKDLKNQKKGKKPSY